jgi:hypothetical protein
MGKSIMKEKNNYTFTVDYWTKDGQLRGTKVTVAASSLSEASDKVDKRYPKAYDISLHSTTSEENLPWE